MAGRPVHPRDAGMLEDIRIWRARGLSMAETAERLGMSRATLYRILAQRGAS